MQKGKVNSQRIENYMVEMENKNENVKFWNILYIHGHIEHWTMNTGHRIKFIENSRSTQRWIFHLEHENEWMNEWMVIVLTLHVRIAPKQTEHVRYIVCNVFFFFFLNIWPIEHFSIHFKSIIFEQCEAQTTHRKQMQKRKEKRRKRKTN